MTQNKRIVFNAAATYGRSLVALCLGLFSARWVLQALGKIDFGLYGVVGGLISFIAFLDAVLRSSVSRFYAFTIGEKSFLPEVDYEDKMLSWFNTALSLHGALALIILIVGLPVCFILIKYVLVIPVDRVGACMIVAAISTLATCISVISVPYTAMFNAMQLIAEMTVFDILRTVCLFVGALALLFVRFDRLIVYASYVGIVSAGINLVLIILARRKFPFCRIRRSKLYCAKDITAVGKYAVWKLFGVLGWSARQNGSIFLINIFFGPIANASFSVASQFAAQSAALSSSLMTALTPALTTIAGTGDTKAFHAYLIRSCKFSSLLLVMLSIPLVSEIDFVLKLWLKNPPELANGICLCMVVVMLVNTLTSGCCASLSASTRIKAWQLVESAVLAAVVPVAFIVYWAGASFVSIGYILIVDAVLIGMIRLYFSQRLIGVKISDMLRQGIAPVLFTGAASALFCASMRMAL